MSVALEKSEYKDFESLEWSTLENLNAVQLCELFINNQDGEIFYCPYQKSYFTYNDEIGLWAQHEKEERSYINNLLSRYVFTLCDSLKTEISFNPQVMSIEKRDSKLAVLKKACNYIDGKAPQITKNNLPSLCKTELNTVDLFNKCINFLPLENGVWSFEHNCIVDYQKEMYFTKKININYNADANTSDIEAVMKQWFKGNDNVINFIKYYIGYCLTGYTTRQDCLIVFGDSAGNGKSTLWETIMSILLGGNKFSYTQIKTEDFSSNNNRCKESLYYLKDARFGLMNEPKTSGAYKIDDAEFKAVIGSTSASAELKGKSKITYKPIYKMVITCNNIPEFNFEDAGLERRIIIVEQNVSFLTEQDYNKLSSEDKASGKYGKRDNDLINKLLNNKEGLMKWALEGAKMFMEDQNKAIPEELTLTKNKVKEDNDELGNWISRNLEVANGEKITISEIKKCWKYQEIDFNQNKKGFNQLLMKKCEALGYKTDSGRAGKAEEKILNCRLVASSQKQYKTEADLFKQGISKVNI
jgi:P4 family phage/plasmid primase-like protien